MILDLGAGRDADEGETVAQPPHQIALSRCTITVASFLAGDHAGIRVTDTGCGMTDGVRGRLFEPFFTTKDVGRGSGQGLALARAIIVEHHHGTINVQSTPAAGSTFTIHRPSKPRQPAASPAVAGRMLDDYLQRISTPTTASD